MLDHRLEQKELAGETRQRRNAGQRYHRHRHCRSQQGRALVQASQGADVAGLAAHQADDDEGGAEGEEIAGQIIEDGGGAVPVEGGIPLISEDKIVGAIGISGSSSANDGLCAQAGVDALK